MAPVSTEIPVTSEASASSSETASWSNQINACFFSQNTDNCTISSFVWWSLLLLIIIAASITCTVAVTFLTCVAKCCKSLRVCSLISKCYIICPNSSANCVKSCIICCCMCSNSKRSPAQLSEELWPTAHLTQPVERSDQVPSTQVYSGRQAGVSYHNSSPDSDSDYYGYQDRQVCTKIVQLFSLN